VLLSHQVPIRGPPTRILTDYFLHVELLLLLLLLLLLRASLWHHYV
jgi:hypothetical protein